MSQIVIYFFTLYSSILLLHRRSLDTFYLYFLGRRQDNGQLRMVSWMTNPTILAALLRLSLIAVLGLMTGPIVSWHPHTQPICHGHRLASAPHRTINLSPQYCKLSRSETCRPVKIFPIYCVSPRNQGLWGEFSKPIIELEWRGTLADGDE